MYNEYDPYSPQPEENPAAGGFYQEPGPQYSPYGQEPVQPPKQKKKRFWPKAVALCLVCALLGTAGGFTAGYLLPGRVGNGGGSTSTVYESDRTPNVVTISHTNTGREMSLEEIYASWVDSTVGIRTEIVTTNYFGQYTAAAAGSGFVISSDGYIVTNYHVINGASSIKVAFNDGTEYDAVLVGGEEVNDVAVLKIEATGLTSVIVGDSDAMHVGETVTAIGNPLGELTFSQTHGIVSALNRTIAMSDGTRMNMIQTDCTINSGNSGGPLFNLYGEVIGITSAKYSNNGSSEAAIEGIGFAIPINDVIGIIKDLMEHGYVTGKPNLGILLERDPVDESAQRYGIPAGVVVAAVLDGSCAQRGGLRAGDIITAVDGVSVASNTQISSELQKHRAGDTVTLTVYRAGETLELPMTLDEDNQARSDALDALREQYNQERQSAASGGSGSTGNSGNSGSSGNSGGSGETAPDYSWPFWWPW